MKTTLLLSIMAAGAVAASAAEKSLTEKTSQSLDKIGEKTKELGSSAITTTKNGLNQAVDAVTPDRDAHKIDVKLNDTEMAIPRSLKSGKTAFVVHNDAKETRNFEVQGEGIDKKFMMGLSPNETKVLHVDLKPGSYKAMSPKGKAEALKADLIVK